MSRTLLSMAMAFLSLLDPGPLDINTASRSDLETLPGIGPEKALAIIDFRESCGPFFELEDLLGVPGIGPATLSEISSMICIDASGIPPADTSHWLPLVDSIADPLLRIAFLDIGEGDATLICAGTGERVLIDGGPDDFGPILPPVVIRLMTMGIDSLDAVLMTHPHEDHIGGLTEVVQRIPVVDFYDPGFAYASPVYEDLLEAIERSSTRYLALESGIRLDFGDGEAWLEVVDVGAGATNLNENSAVMVVRCGRFSLLLAGDIEEDSEMRLTPDAWPVTCILAPHHGSRTSAFPPFLRRLRPQIAVFSAGRDNPFGHPHLSVLERYTELDAMILRTDRAGTIFVDTDGSSVSVRTTM